MNKELFIKNRNKIFNQMIDNSMYIIYSGKKLNDDIFKQKYNVNRNYYYICGLFEFDNIIILNKINNRCNATIFINKYDELKAKWYKAPFSKEEVSEISGILDVRYLDNFDMNLNSLIGAINNIYFDFDPSIPTEISQAYISSENIKTKYPWVNLLNGHNFFKKSRMIKEKEEIEEMKKAIEITNKGINNILDHLGEAYEYQLESYFDQAIKYYGATGYAFSTIAASGENGVCLHYSENNKFAKNGELILFDLGCSLNMYCSDISRTFPISGKFSERQKLLYNIVLNGQKLVFNNAKPGITIKELNNILIDYYAKELKNIGLIKNDDEVSKYYYHNISHNIGLDCHDLSFHTEPLKAGQIISNEPGLYIKEEGIGIRIEDDILITDDGAEWLSPQIIKEVSDIEKYLKNRN